MTDKKGEDKMASQAIGTATGTQKHLIDIVKYRFWWFALSALLIVPGIVAMVYSSITYPNHAPLKVGIDYTGGTILQYSIDKTVSGKDVTKTSENLEAAGIENPFLQIINVSAAKKSNTMKSIISVRTKFIGEKNSTDLDKVSSVVKCFKHFKQKYIFIVFINIKSKSANPFYQCIVCFISIIHI